jgi:hypothetical protein
VRVAVAIIITIIIIIIITAALESRNFKCLRKLKGWRISREGCTLGFAKSGFVVATGAE